MLLYIIRHGDPDYATDSLTPRGVLQAEAVAKRLAASGIDRVYSSPMGRARQTAEPTCRLLGIDYTVEPWAREIRREQADTTFPDGVKKSVALVPNTYFREKGMWDLSCSNALQCSVLEGTDLASAAAYVAENGRDFLERLGYREEDGNYRILRPNEEKVALFCHGNFARVWLSDLLKIPVHMMLASFGYNHTGVTVLNFKNNENGITAPRCLCFGDTSHLYAHGPDMNYNGTFTL